MAIAYIGIGSNIGNSKNNCLEAVERLNQYDKVRLLSNSSLYETEPVGGPDQNNYINGVLMIDTENSPEELFVKLKDIEKTMGREETGRNFPRVIDLDILLFDKQVVKLEHLEIPHPRMHEREFVLRGLVEIAPNEVHPVLERTASELYSELL